MKITLDVATLEDAEVALGLLIRHKEILHHPRPQHRDCVLFVNLENGVQTHIWGTEDRPKAYRHG